MPTKELITAIAVFGDSSSSSKKKEISGTVRFAEYAENKSVMVTVNIKGLKKNALHGFHVHEYGDMSDHCTSMCNHFNPFNHPHGGPKSKTRHVGDLGNLVSDNNGNAEYTFEDKFIKLRGTKANIIGRGLIIHEDEDDLGLGGHEDSLTTGHAGKRIACAVIGHSK
jgi:Cu-Zn family superoxide dismutase